MVRDITILGATGSIGRQTLDVVRAHPDKLRVRCLTAHNNMADLPALLREFFPDYLAVRTEEQAKWISTQFPRLHVVWGEGALAEAATAFPGAIVMNAVVGSVGIRPTLAAMDCGCDIALANKETLVAAGDIVMATARNNGVSILPVDSEHSALMQCLRGYVTSDVEKLILTASGGPFRGFNTARLNSVTVEDALAHPTWNMGAKITVDSATLMNKGLEVIEAHFLFGVAYESIEVVVHPQSIVHSLVQFRDGALLAQLGAADMRVPIQFAVLGNNGRASAPWHRLDLSTLTQLTFDKPDYDTFPALSMAYECGKRAGTYPAVMNAANEVAAMAFLQGDLEYLGIYEVVSGVLDHHVPISHPTIDEIFFMDAWAREIAHTMIRERRQLG